MTTVDDLRTRVVEGQHLWGRLSVRPVGRTLWSARTLVVFPPGTDTRERLRLRIWHAWPVVGAVLALGVLAATTPTPGLGATAAVLVYVLGFGALARATRRLRPLVREVTVTTFHGSGPAEVHGDVRLLQGSIDALSVMEDALRRHRIDRVDFESVWADVWNALPPRH